MQPFIYIYMYTHTHTHTHTLTHSHTYLCNLFKPVPSCLVPSVFLICFSCVPNVYATFRSQSHQCRAILRATLLCPHPDPVRTIYVCMYIRMHVCMYVCTCCMYIRMHVCMYVCTCFVPNTLNAFLNKNSNTTTHSAITKQKLHKFAS